MWCYAETCAPRPVSLLSYLSKALGIEPTPTSCYRVRVDVVGSEGMFALRQEHFARLLGTDNLTADALFRGIFDTDGNGLVDAIETMRGHTLLA